jgi:hypothetical protein
MAPSAPFTTTRLRRVLHWLFPSCRAAVAAAEVEAAASLLHLPLAVHVALALLAHLACALTE